jgi:hypothetical protein
LEEFISMPMVEQKISRISLSLSTILFERLKKIITSTTNNKCETKHELPIIIPLKEPFVEATLSALLTPLATRRKWMGDNGNHCIIPFSSSKKGDVSPLIKTTNKPSLYTP